MTAVDRVQEQLARNAALSFRNNTKYSYLLHYLLSCAECGLPIFGVVYKAAGNQPERRYYECHGGDCILTAREQACPRRAVKADELETTVWRHITQLLADPAQLLAQFQRFAQVATEGAEKERAETERMESRIRRLARGEIRLVDAYQISLISLAELAERRRRLIEQRDQQLRFRQERARIPLTREELEGVQRGRLTSAAAGLA